MIFHIILYMLLSLTLIYDTLTMKMFITLVLVSFVSNLANAKPKCKCGILLPALKTKSNAKIHNGQDAPVNEYPWHVLVQLKFQNYPNPNKFSFFGGILVSKRHVVTAAHSFYSPYYNGRYGHIITILTLFFKIN